MSNYGNISLILSVYCDILEKNAVILFIFVTMIRPLFYTLCVLIVISTRMGGFYSYLVLCNCNQVPHVANAYKIACYVFVVISWNRKDKFRSYLVP